jgi:hypothetical protein
MKSTVEKVCSVLYQGHVRVYLQGQNALMVSSVERSDEIVYFIGGEETNLVIRDFRPGVIVATREAIHRQYQNGFVNVFNQRAYAQVWYLPEEERLEIHLFEPQNQAEPAPTLWTGVLDDGTMPAYQVEWEVFRKTAAQKTAFVAMLT